MSLVSDVREFVKSFYAKNDKEHNIEHADAVFDLAIRMNNYLIANHQMGANVNLITIAAYMHDMYAHLGGSHALHAYHFIMHAELPFLKDLSLIERELVAIACREHGYANCSRANSILATIIQSANLGYPPLPTKCSIDKKIAQLKSSFMTSGMSEHLARITAVNSIKDKYSTDISSNSTNGALPELYREYFSVELEKLNTYISIMYL